MKPLLKVSNNELSYRLNLNYNNVYWDQYRGKVSETVQNMNDSYLKAEGLKEGTLSYDLVTDLIVSYELQNQKSPVNR